MRLIESAQAMADEGSPAGRYMAALTEGGVARFIANAASRPMLLVLGTRALPVTVDDGGYGRSYVASPHSAYVLYAREEVDIVGMTRGRAAARAALATLDLLLRAADVNRAVHIDNWLLSTNLHDGWDGAELPAIRRLLAERFPRHLLILRSLDTWSASSLLEAARSDGWILVPARQIWVVDDLARDWLPRNNHGNDRRALVASGPTVDMPAAFSDAEAARVAELYRLLYIARYSRLNPDFTPDFIRMTQQVGLFAYRVARDADGRIMAVTGMLTRGGLLTPPVVGYDTARLQREGLYRIASWMFCDHALAKGLRLHGSAGAADFKRRRGAHGEIEYMAVHAGHVSAGRRAVIRALAGLLETWLVPMMRREGW
jgi:hypothetical protein